MRNYIILDLEWNQCSGGKLKENREIPFEIVEIGAIKLDENKRIIEKYSQLIKPQVYLQMHYMTKKIIHINMDELEEGKEFSIVIEDFLKWCGDDYIFCTWGSLDLLELQRNMQFYKLDPLSKGPIMFLDIQKMFSIAYKEGKLRRSLEYAVDFLNIEKDEEFHRAISDAYYTAKVFAHLNSKSAESHFSIDVYHIPRSEEEEIFVTFDDYSKYISRDFKNKTVALADKEVTSTRCYICGKNAKRKIKWFSVNMKHYYSLSFCNHHGYLRGKIRIKKTEDGKIYIIKTLKLINEEEAMNLIEKKNHIKEIKKVKRKIEQKEKKELI
ncbi:MAG: exonuclease domain-containing protein [Lachnospiraceae bacterium]|nr:exonuclease domain-containing protein [Lachnospiraceae bacterium]